MAFIEARKTIQRLPYLAGQLDPHGNPVTGYGDPVDVAVYGWGPRSGSGSSEPTYPNRDAVVEGLTVMAPPGTVFGAHDRAVVDGVTYDVEGEVGDWGHGPFGWDPGISFALTRVEG